MANAVDEKHHAAMRTFREETADVHLDAVSAARRRFMKRASVGGAAIALAPALLPMSGLLPAADAQGLSDDDIAAYAQSVELAAVAAYQAAGAKLSAATKPVGDLFA